MFDLLNAFEVAFLIIVPLACMLCLIEPRKPTRHRPF